MKLIQLSAAGLALFGVVALTGCGGGSASGSDGSSASPTALSAQQVDEAAKTTTTDAQALAEKLLAEAKKSGKLPASADGLVTLASGNTIGGYKSRELSADVCVQHTEKQSDPSNPDQPKTTAVAATQVTVYLARSGRAAEVGEPAVQRNTGCL